MDSTIANGFTSGAGYTPTDLKVFILTVCGSLVFLIAMWLVNQVLQGYRSNALDQSDVIESLASITALVATLVAVLWWA